ncbi:MAG TPA: hypothetical protein DFS52_28080 [Myxococcales bacterium]|nr:hypothetical protein [Myxococcales bacterium]
MRPFSYRFTATLIRSPARHTEFLVSSIRPAAARVCLPAILILSAAALIQSAGSLSSQDAPLTRSPAVVAHSQPDFIRFAAAIADLPAPFIHDSVPLSALCHFCPLAG